MKKILFFLLCPMIIWAAKDTLQSGTLWSTATWLAGYPTVNDTGYFNNISPTHDTANVDIKWGGLKITPTDSKTHWMAGRTDTVATLFCDSGTGTKHYGNKLTMTGDNGKIIISSGSGAITGGTLMFDIQGVGDALEKNKSFDIKGINIGSGKSLNIMKWGGGDIYNSTPLLVMGNNSSLTQSSTLPIYFSPTLAGQAYFSFEAGYTFNGTGPITLRSYILGNKSYTIPEMNYTGSGTWTIKDYGSGYGQRVTLTGNCNFGTGTLDIYAGSANPDTIIFNTGGYGFKCGTLRTGNNNATGGSKTSFGASACTLSTWNENLWNSPGVVNVDSLQTSHILVYGSITFPAATVKKIVPGTSNLTLGGASAQVVTLSGNQLYDVIVNNSGTETVKFADSLSLINDLTLTDGRDSLVKVSCNHYTNNSNDSVFHGDSLKIKGSFYRNNAKTKRTAGIMLMYGTQDGSMTLSDLGTIGATLINRPGKTITGASTLRFNRLHDSLGALKMGVYALACTTLTVRDTGLQCAAVTLDTMNSYNGGVIGGGTITRWNWLVDALKYVLTAGTTLTVPSVDGMGGTPGAMDSMVSATPGSTATIDLGGATVTAPYFYAKDITVINGTIIATTGGVNGGNTSGITWLSSSSSRRRGGWLGLDLSIRP